MGIDGEELLNLKHKHIVKSVNFSKDSQSLATASNDKILRIFDLEKPEESKLNFEGHTSGIELSKDQDILTVAHGTKITFYNAETFEKIKEVAAPAPVFSASLLYGKRVFVFGGEDCKLYKYNYDTGEEIESFKGHFGPVHCVRFAPDGELYASGSEDGTLRLWQTEVGKTYGLWKCIDTINEGVTKPEAVVS